MRIHRTHELGLDEARSRVDEIADELGKKFSLTSHWRGDELVFKGRGVSGRISVADDSVEIFVKVGLALMMMENSIRTAIENSVDGHLS